MNDVLEQDVFDDERDLTGVKVLVVDDSRDSLDLLFIILSAKGADVKTATSAEAGLELSGCDDFDLVISDISMPGMDGYDFIRQLRLKDRYKETPAIAATGLGRKEDAMRATEAGFSAHFSKPLDFHNLLAWAHRQTRITGKDIPLP